MASIKFNKVSVDFPIYNANGRSLKSHLFKISTGGQLKANQDGLVVVRAIDEVSFEFQDGERIGILGHNGAGKSTLLRLLSKVYHPSAGTTEIHGEVGSLIDISLGIDPEATGKENIFLRAGLLGMRRSEIKKHLDEIIEFAEIGNYVDMPVRTYSTGMHLRLAFAVSTMVRPEILLMDEWLSVGDEEFKQKAEARMRAMVESTNIIVIASHQQDIFLDTCTRVLWLEHGKIRMDGTPKTVCDAYFGGILAATQNRTTKETA